MGCLFFSCRQKSADWDLDFNKEFLYHASNQPLCAMGHTVQSLYVQWDTASKTFMCSGTHRPKPLCAVGHTVQNLYVQCLYVQWNTPFKAFMCSGAHRSTVWASFDVSLVFINVSSISWFVSIRDMGPSPARPHCFLKRYDGGNDTKTT